MSAFLALKKITHMLWFILQHLHFTQNKNAITETFSLFPILHQLLNLLEGKSFLVLFFFKLSKWKRMAFKIPLSEYKTK